MNGQHTSGPWERLQGFAEQGHPIYKEGRGVTRIVQKRAPGQTEFVRVALVDSDAVSADARLIALAPDLLDALQGVLKCVSFMDCGSYLETTPSFQKARAIIASSKGAA